MSEVNITVEGMSLRDWFAGMALQGILSNELCDPYGGQESQASHAYVKADAMIEEKNRLEKERGNK